MRLRVDKPSGERWELALELLMDGGEGVALGTVLLQRYTGWPGADGRVHVSIFTAWDPSSLTETVAAQEIEEGRSIVQSVLEADGRLGRIFDRYGVVWDYRYDYGMGAVTLADLGADGAISWKRPYDERLRRSSD